MSKKILIVEDTDDVREMYSFALQQKHQVEEAIDGEEAVNKILAPGANYDLILLDVMLPKMDGISILKKIKAPEAPSKDIPVFLFTNLGMDEVVSEATSLGAAKCFVKANILPETILKEIDEYFANPQAAAQTAPAPAGGAPAPTPAPAAQPAAPQAAVPQAPAPAPTPATQPAAPTAAPTPPPAAPAPAPTQGTAGTDDILNLDQL